MVKKNITIHDVAKHANVSIATVSNVINQTGRVSEKTVLLVKETIKKLGYYPNISARTMKKKSSNLIGIIIPFLAEEGNLHDNPFYWNLVSGIEKISRKNDFHIVLSIITNQNIVDLNFVKERDLDGVIIIGALQDTPLVNEIESLGIPSVFIDSYLKDEDAYQVYLDDRQGGYVGVKYLLDQGHQHIGIIGGDKNVNGVMQARYEGAKKACINKNISIDNLFYIDTPVSMKSGYEAGQMIIDHPKVTAVFCFSDIIAIGLLKFFKEHKINIPDDYALLGFDNIEASEYTMPALTTIDQNAVEKGKVAAELLIEQIIGKQPRLRKIVLPIDLVKRDST